MSETKLEVKSEAHSENFCEIFGMSNSENFLIFSIFYF